MIPRRAMYSLLLGRKFLYEDGCFADHWKQQVYVRSGKDAYLLPRTAPPLEEIEPMIYNPSAAGKGKLRKGQQPTFGKIDLMKAKPATLLLLPKVHNKGLRYYRVNEIRLCWRSRSMSSINWILRKNRLSGRRINVHASVLMWMTFQRTRMGL